MERLGPHAGREKVLPAELELLSRSQCSYQPQFPPPADLWRQYLESEGRVEVVVVETALVVMLDEKHWTVRRGGLGVPVDVVEQVEGAGGDAARVVGHVLFFGSTVPDSGCGGRRPVEHQGAV